MKDGFKIDDVVDQTIMVLVSVVFNLLPAATQVLIATFIKDSLRRSVHIVHLPFSYKTSLRRELKEVRSAGLSGSKDQVNGYSNCTPRYDKYENNRNKMVPGREACCY